MACFSIPVVKQRMQMYNSPYKSCGDCIQRIYHTEGLRAFYRSYSTQLSMNLPFQSLHFIVYELCQDRLNAERQYSPRSHVISGALAGGIAAAATTPLDVCKTLLNTQEQKTLSKHGTITGMGNALRTVYRHRGIRGYFQGVSARVVYVMPSTAISWSVYEFLKYALMTSNGSASCTGYSSVQVHAACSEAID